MQPSLRFSRVRLLRYVDPYLLMVICRKSCRTGSSFPNLLRCTRYSCPLDLILLPPSTMSGSDTERFQPPLLQRYLKSRSMVFPLSSNIQPNNKLVWNETIRIVEDLFQNVWGDRKVVTCDHALDITMPVCSVWLCSTY